MLFELNGLGTTYSFVNDDINVIKKTLEPSYNRIILFTFELPKKISICTQYIPKTPTGSIRLVICLNWTRLLLYRVLLINNGIHFNHMLPLSSVIFTRYGCIMICNIVEPLWPNSSLEICRLWCHFIRFCWQVRTLECFYCLKRL